MITVNVHRLHTVLFTIGVTYKLTALFTYAFLFTMWIFFHTYCTIVYSTMFTVRLHWIHTVLLLLLSPVYLLCCLHVLSFSQCEYFPHITVQLSIYNVYIESSLLHTYCLQLVSNKLTALITYAFLFTMWIFFHSYYIIFYSTMFTVRLHWIHTVLFTITLPSVLTLFFTCAFILTMWIFPHLTVQLSIYNVYIESSLLQTYCSQLVSTVYQLCCLLMLSFSQCEYFSIH